MSDCGVGLTGGIQLTSEKKEPADNKYCLEQAVYRRSIIRQQCHLIDKEFKKEMPEF